MVYLFDISSDCMKYIDKHSVLLSEQRLNKVERYRFDNDKALSVYSYILLRYALYNEHRITEMPIIFEDKFNKPCLLNLNLKFNISHCNNSLLCGISDDEIGVDIQDYSEKITDIQSMFLTEREAEIIESFSNKETTKELMRIWTIKEAYGKYYGKGLCYELNQTDFSCIVDDNVWQKYKNLKIYSRTLKNYALSVCANVEVEIKKVKAEELFNFADFLITLCC